MSSCYLSLDSGGGVLTSLEDIVPTVLRMFLGTPGNTSRYYKKYKKSFRMLDSEHGTMPEDLVNYTRITLQEIYDRYFPDRRVIVQVSHEMFEDNIRYSLIIDIVYSMFDGTTVGLISNKRVFIDPTTGKFKIEYDKKGDSIKIIDKDMYDDSAS